MNRTQKGYYYRLKTRKWLVAKGYDVYNAEQIKRLYNKKTRQVIFNKYDIMGADLFAVNDEQYIHVNSICNRSDISSHIKGFLKFRCPPFIDRWIVLWTPGKRGEPEIIDVNAIKETK